MRLKLFPENILERLALLSGRLPEPLLELYFSMGISSTLIAGLRLNIFELVKSGKNTWEEIVRETGSNPEGIRTLLDALNGFGYLKKKGDRYLLTRKTEKWILGDFIESYLLMADIKDRFANLEEVIKRGGKSDFHDNKNPEFWEHYLIGIYKFSKIASKEVAFRLRMKRGGGRVLDLGGGHGLYTATLLKMNRRLQGVILDLPEACKIGKRIVKIEGVENRVRFLEGDMREIEWGGGYDLVLFFNIIHIFTEEENIILLKRAREVLNEGGRIAILDSEFPDKEDLSAVAGFNQLLFYLINNSRVFNESRIKKWVEVAGYRRIRRSRLLTVPMTLFLTAQK
ncbi:MAG TPA: methyltransferase domain-containing protein [candidate division WOR-3 bacterium]|uniref:Methyltransferase domain-containing protein n=1 Tax=candidate division WOR-3 bacterium TaxID=2052148 RepID=A0A7C0VBM9_UNCW3|nr:methyltransferase domain-containing protein [candidate division WOR-3 bacterium]